MRPDPPRDPSLQTPQPDLTESMQLLMRHQQGDSQALNSLLERYQGRIRRIVRIKLGSRLRQHMESVDIVQEANVIAMRKMGDLVLEDHASIIKWLSQVVLNKIRDAHGYLTAEKRDVGREVDVDPEVGEDGDEPALYGATHECSPEEQASRNELCRILDEAMMQLADGYREVILIRDYYGAQWSQVHQQLGLTDAAEARKLHRRAWIALRRAIGPRMEGLV